MKYFLDTEFIEGFKKPISWLPTIGKFNKPYHYIQLISIGIVAEDGREYYAISNEYNPDDASDWVKINVLCKIATVPQVIRSTTHTDDLVKFKVIGAKSNKEIAKEIIEFINSEPVSIESFSNCSILTTAAKENIKRGYLKPEFYAYYADYDWVVFCSLFGTMMDLPKGFPMYCKDLKQTLDEKANLLDSSQLSKLAHSDIVKHNVFSTYDTGVLKCSKTDLLKKAINYPKQTNEHNALADAKWNFELYKFLKSI